MLGPAKPPIDFDFQALSFASKTSCRVVTGLCDARPYERNEVPDPSHFNFVCNASMARLNMTGNFRDLLAPLNSTCSLPHTSSGRPSWESSNATIWASVLGANTIAPSKYNIGFQYFNDAQKQRQSTSYPRSSFVIPNDLDEEDNHELYWAMVWYTEFSSSLTSGPERLVTKETAAVGVDDTCGGGSSGLLSCETSLREVVSFAACQSSMSLFT